MGRVYARRFARRSVEKCLATRREKETRKNSLEESWVGRTATRMDEEGESRVSERASERAREREREKSSGRRATASKGLEKSFVAISSDSRLP